MNTFTKPLLFTTFLLALASNTFAMDVDNVDAKSSSISPKTRLSLVLPSKTPPYSNTQISYEVTLRGTRNGEAKFTLQENASEVDPEGFYHHPQQNNYFPLKNIPFKQRKNLKSKHIVKRYYLSKDLDLSQFEGDIRASASQVLTGALYIEHAKFVSHGIDATFPLEIRHARTVAFNANTESVWVIVNSEFSKADVVVVKGKGPKSLLSLALEKTEDVIKSKGLTKESVKRQLPTDVSRLIQTTTWEKRKAKFGNKKDIKKAAPSA